LEPRKKKLLYPYIFFEGVCYTIKNIEAFPDVYNKICDGQIFAALESAALFGKGFILHIVGEFHVSAFLPL
jgi:hypothetical protein